MRNRARWQLGFHDCDEGITTEEGITCSRVRGYRGFSGDMTQLDSSQ